MIKLYKAGIKGIMFNWIKNFLCDRTIQIRVGTVMSDVYEVENGTPQGSVISPVLFNIMVNDMLCNFRPFGKGGETFHISLNKQKALDRVTEWANEWGLKYQQKNQSI